MLERGRGVPAGRRQKNRTSAYARTAGEGQEIERIPIYELAVIDKFFHNKYGQLHGLSVHSLCGGIVRQATGTPAAGHEMGVFGGSQAISDKLESSGAAHSSCKRHGVGEKPPAAGEVGWQAPAAKALCRAVTGHPGKQSACAQSSVRNGPPDPSPDLKME